MSTVAEAAVTQAICQTDPGDHQPVFAELTRRYIDFVYVTALRQTNDPAMAADVMQAVLLVFARRGRSIRTAALPTWLHRVTTYAVKNAQRSQRRRRRHERAAAAQRREVSMPSHSSLDESESIKPLLDRAIASLPAKDQTVVIERFLCGRELGDVAALLGASTAATQKRLERAVGRLRNYFQRHGIVLSSAGVPWPAFRAAPISLPHAAGHSASLSSHSLAGKIMSHLFWTKVASVTASVALAAAVTGATGVELSHLARADLPVTQMAANPALSAHLSHGVTLTIDGIASLTAPDHIWQADGSTNTEADWHVPPNAQFATRVENGVTLPQYAVAVRVTGKGSTPPELCGFSFNGSIGVDNGFTPVLSKSTASIGETLSGLINSFSPTDTAVRMRFSVAVGDYARPPEAPTIMGNADGPAETGKAFGGLYVIGVPFLHKGAAAVAVSTTGIDGVQDLIFANVAFNGHGKAIPGHIVEGTSTGPLLQRVFVFDGLADLTTIRSVELQFRPIEWCEFENVSLRSGLQTQVKITTGGVPATQQASASNEVYVGGDAPQTGVFEIGPKLLTEQQLLAAAGVHLTLRDTYSVTHRIPRTPTELANVNQNGGEQLLEPGDQMIVTLGPPPVPADSRLAPFTDIRWKGDDPEIQIKGVWYGWIAINDIPIASVIAAAQDLDERLWQKRVAEDLVQVMNHVPGESGRSDVGKDVRLTILDEHGAVTLPHVAMTEDNRRSVYQNRRNRNED